MTRSLLSFPSSAMNVPKEEVRVAAKVAHAVIQEAKDVGVSLFSGGLDEDVEPVMVTGDMTVTNGTHPEAKEINGGFTVVHVPYGRRPWSGPQRSRPPATMRNRSANSISTRSPDPRRYSAE